MRNSLRLVLKKIDSLIKANEQLAKADPYNTAVRARLDLLKELKEYIHELDQN